MVSVALFPFMILFYHPIYFPLIGTWSLVSAVYVFAQFIILSISSAIIGTTAESDPMTWENYYARHQTHYSYNM